MMRNDSKPEGTLQNSEKLHKYIARCGVTSRRKAEELIKAGKVKVDGKIIDNVAARIVPDKHTVSINEKELNPEKKRKAFVLYKPPQCVTTLDDPQGRQTIVDYFPKTSTRLFPVGRLDYDTQGIIIITNDGDLAQAISHPAGHINKTYFVKIRGKLTPNNIKKLDPRPVIDGKKLQFVKYGFIRIINDKTWIEVVLQEGINRQIKKMFHGFGYDVLKIKRISIGPVHLGELRMGESRPMTRNEIDFFLEGSNQ